MASGAEDRAYWVGMAVKVASPVLRALAARELKAKMPVEGCGDERYAGGRQMFSHLEAIARLLVGIAPWLECAGLSGEEEILRAEFAELTRQAIDSATDPQSPDFVNFSYSFQPIVDGAFLCHAILRAPTELFKKLDARVQKNLVDGLKSTRGRKPHFNNWLLFSAMIETGIKVMVDVMGTNEGRINAGAAEFDHMRVDYALRQHEQWYKGDGMYGDGPDFHNDYYNSFVIQPMLVDIIETVGGTYPEWAALKANILKRAVRYGEVQERQISPEGYFTPMGRSLAYRCGAFQHLAQMALQDRLGKLVSPAQVRCGLTALMKRSLGVPGTFDEQGWLTIGFAGHQPEIGEMYISTGSLYLCSGIFLPLGLPPSHAFWSGPETAWTSKRMWSGGAAPIDHALDHEVI